MSDKKESASVSVPQTSYGTTSQAGTTVVPAASSPVSPISQKYQCLPYGLFLFFGYLICLVLRNNTVQFLSKLPWLSSGCSDERCYGSQGVYRVSFALLLFFIIHWLFATRHNLCVPPETRVAFQTTKMLWKVPVFIVTTILSFLLPNGFFVGYGWVCAIASAFFLIAQVLVLIDFAYAWNEEWIEKSNDGQDTRWTYGLLLCSTLLFAGGVTLLGFQYVWFPCDEGKALTSITLLLNVFAMLLSIRVQHGSVVPSSLVMCYNAILCFTALTAEPESCNTIFSNTSSTNWAIVLNTILSAISLTYAAASSAHSRGTFSLSVEDPDAPIDDAESQCSAYTYFHGMMALASCYLAMLLTSWDITGTSSANNSFDSSSTSMWVKMSCSFVTAILYLWSLVAPYVFPDRF